jgi:DnaJ-class molecular chaperone
MSLYEKLGISKDASKDDIKKAFRKLAVTHHPDKGGNEEKFKEISHAYEVLTDDEKKRHYDLTGSEEPHQQFNPFQQGGFSFQGGFPFEFMFRGQQPRREEPVKKLEDTIHTIDISLKDVFFGKTKIMVVTTLTKCDCNSCCGKCNGNGRIRIVKQFGPMIQSMETQCDMCVGKGYIIKGCDKCSSTGQIKTKEQYSVVIPIGAIDGHEKRIVGKGQQPFKQTEIAGDLVFKIKVLNDAVFKRRGNELIYESKISFIDSICGCDIIIPHFEAELTINTSIFGIIKEGKEYVIKSKGINEANLILIFKVDEYTSLLSEEKRNLLREILG